VKTLISTFGDLTTNYSHTMHLHHCATLLSPNAIVAEKAGLFNIQPTARKTPIPTPSLK
jgi:hypothetical protein